MNRPAVYEIEHKRVDYLFTNLTNGLLGIFGLLFFVSFIYYSHVDSLNLFTWVILNMIALLMRVTLLIRYKKAEINIQNIGKYYYLFTLFALFSAVAWGSSAFFIFPQANEYQIVLLLLTTGVMSAAVITFASKVKSFYLYVLFVLSPYIYVLLFSELEIHHVLAYIMLFFTVVIFSISKKTSKNVEDNIFFEYKNSVLVKKLEEKVVDANSANRAKSEFLSVMSHEIRTPLNAIIGFVKILKEKEDDKEKQKYLDTIDKSSNILINVINDILDITKIEANKLVLEEITFEPKEEFESLFLLFEKNAQEKGVYLINDISKDIPHSLKGDVLRLKQVLSNLLSNAIKFTSEEGEVTLSISFNSEEERLYIGVKDSGIGISSENIKIITDSFTQADSSTARKYGGTGLGLSIVTAILKLFDSKLMIESQLNEGSNFHFSLAVKVEESVKVEEESVEDIDFEGKKVLVAEDNKTNQMLIEMLLEDMNLEVVIANDGAEALQKIKEENFDTVLMDINMPNMNGIESMQEIQKYEKESRDKSTPIIALTANAVSGDREKYLELGFDEYLSKPIDVSLLEKVLYKNLFKTECN